MSTRGKRHQRQPHRGRLLLRLLREESGQDLIEYGLLAVTIGIAGILSWQAIVGGIGAAYQGWDSGTQAVWEPQDPGAGP